VAIVGIVWFRESRDFWRLCFIGLILVGGRGLETGLAP